MADPGAKMSTTLPKFEKDDRASALVLDPTVMAALTRAGDWLDAFVLPLPAATAYVTPAVIELFTAVSSDVLMPPPRLMFATAGAARCDVTQFTPAITPEMLPDPEQFSTRTANSRAALATPYVDPPTVPATCVPWPLQSSPLPPMLSKATDARPPNCVCVTRIPVSMM